MFSYPDEAAIPQQPESTSVRPVSFRVCEACSEFLVTSEFRFAIEVEAHTGLPTGGDYTETRMDVDSWRMQSV